MIRYAIEGRGLDRRGIRRPGRPNARCVGRPFQVTGSVPIGLQNDTPSLLVETTLFVFFLYP